MTYEVVFSVAMDLMDERLPSGQISASDTQDYRAKSPGLLTILATELLKISGDDSGDIVTALTDEVPLPGSTAVMVLPYGLAAHLLLDENPSAAGFFQQRYEELKRKTAGKAVQITDVYGLRNNWTGV